MRATLFGVPASHPSLAAELMLEHKGVEVRRIDLVSALHRGLVRLLGFPGVTVPAVRIDGRKLQGTSTISRALDGLVAERPLFPREQERREAVERAEAWGDEVLQPVARRIIWAALRRNRSTIATYLEGSRTGVPIPVAAVLAGPISRLAARLNHADDETVRSDLAALPGLLDRVDELLRDGVIGGPERNAADFQIATSVALMLTMDDLRPPIEGRAAGRHAREVAPGYPGRLPPALPSAWLPA